jgi:alpha-L-rhamnosidase
MMLLVVLAGNTRAEPLAADSLVCEYLRNPIGIDVTIPRLSWEIRSGERNVMQRAYEVRVSTDAEFHSIVWHTGRVSSDQSVSVPYAGPPLTSRQRYYWQVRVWDNHGNESPWSAPHFWEMGLLGKGDWKAQWISPATERDTLDRPPIMFRRTFVLRAPIARARMYVTSHGLYEARINGQRVGNDELTPGWTSYHKRLQYQVYDVTDLLARGDNAVGVTVGSGWYRGFVGWGKHRNAYGSHLALLVQLEVTYADGTGDTVVTDGRWKYSTGPIRMSEIYMGEAYDARLEQVGWDRASFLDTAWAAVRTRDIPLANLIGTMSPPVRQHEMFHPVSIHTAPNGETVVDFGQNLVGKVRLTVTGRHGDRITLRHAEVLDAKGDLYTENLRSAKQEVRYTVKGEGKETYEPHFTFSGFRYVGVTGYPGELTPDDLQAVALYSDLQQTGSFACSDSLVNQLFHNIQWGQKGNFLDVPTDCPQRDERLGWTGDAQVFSSTAALNMNVAPFFTKWLKDLAADQERNGAVPYVIPNIFDSTRAASAGWSDASTVIPWNMYLAYGDKRILEEQYTSMQAWVRYMESHSRAYLWNTGFHFGDWLFYRPVDDNDGRSAVTDKYLIAQAYFIHSTDLLIRAASVLGKTEDVRRYASLADHLREAYLREYVTPNGRLVSGTQTAYVLALDFDLLPDSLRPQAAERLVDNIRRYGNHLTTGFLGTPHLCQVLTRFGHTDVAYDVFLQKTYPSWLYPVTMGATTIWERWDGIRPDGSFENPGMNSFNHYAYGAIGHWMYCDIAGIRIDPSSPGYRHILIEPHPGGHLSWARAEVKTMYGVVASAWSSDGTRTEINVTIPPNTTAEVVLPGSAGAAVTEHGTRLEKGRGFTVRPNERGDACVSLGSGTYRFAYRPG